MIVNLRRSVLFASDVTALSSATLLAYALVGEHMAGDHHVQYTRMLMTFFILAAVCIGYFIHKGHYKWRNPWWQQVRQTVRTCVIFMLICLLINAVALPDVHAKLWIGLTWFFAAVFVLSFRWVGRAFLKTADHWDIPTILVGGGGTENVTETIYALRSEAYLTYALRDVALIGCTDEQLAQFKARHPDIPFRTDIPDIPTRSMVILCPEQNDPTFLKDCIDKVLAAGARFAIVPPTHGFSLYGLQTQFFFGHRIVLLESRIRIRTAWGRVTKMLLDRVGAAVGLILLAPLFFVLARKVKKDGGPAFYHQMRIGRNGKKFKCWKFRSMIVNADKVLEDYLASNPEAREEYARDFKLKNDPRITKVGHLLRKSSLDEIPQLYNVLKGEMSLVGPRPIVDAEVPYYADKYDHYLSVRPGITGLWQVSGRNDITYDERVSLDVWYVDNWNVWNDIVIILKTIYVVLARKGAY